VFGVEVIAIIVLAQFMWLLPVHLTTLAVTAVAIVVSDCYGLLWLIGKKKLLPTLQLNFLHRVVWIGLGLMIVSGAIMAWSSIEYLLLSKAFLIKMVFVGALIVNSFVIHRHLNVSFTTTFKDVPKKEKITILLSAAVSTLSWVGAFTAAQYLNF